MYGCTMHYLIHEFVMLKTLKRLRWQIVWYFNDLLIAELHEALSI